jgi:hypothetical protein
LRRRTTVVVLWESHDRWNLEIENCHIFLTTVFLMIIRIAMVVGITIIIINSAAITISSIGGVFRPSHEMKVPSYAIA